MLAASAGALSGGGAAAAETAKQQYFELHWFHLRNGAQTQRTQEFFATVYAPALRRLGLPPVGFFQPVIGEGSPFWLVLLTLPTLDAIETVSQRLAADADYAKSSATYLRGDPPYERREISLLKAFPGMPNLVLPPAREGAGHIFEIRTYESNTSATLARKIKMFESGEIGIFQRLGMQPVFFGQTLIGRNMPNLTYMLAYEDMTARDRVWKAFGTDPEWQKLRTMPGNSDAEIVSNISNLIVRPAPFSQIK